MAKAVSPSPPQSGVSNAAREVGSPGIAALMMGALGVVFGDIGTSPLYALRETFAGVHALPIDRPHVLGVLSLVFWTINIIVSIKYVAIIMRADNRGEGGSLALLALLERAVTGRRVGGLITLLGIFAAALFYGDCMITPAISVLSAVEGLDVAAPELKHFVVPITIAVLVALFLIQRRGAGAIGNLFGPIMLLWFGTLAVAGLASIVRTPHVLAALSPHYALMFIFNDGWTAFLSFGSVFLAVTGAEALYADMGHFGRLPIRLAWYGFVLPALVLNYFGQGAILLRDPTAIDNPFFRLAPDVLTGPLVALAGVATIIASQAVISGAFSVTQQTIHLGYLPRLRTLYTSDSARGQIYIPFVNWMLLTFVLILVLGFETSSNLAAAYGVAVSGSMGLDTILVTLVATLIWKWSLRKALMLSGLFFAIDIAFLFANATKIPEGGWFPLAVALTTYVLLTTWKSGRALLTKRELADSVLLKEILPSLGAQAVKVSGTAMFLTGDTTGVPAALLHNIKHNKVLHEHNVILTVTVEDRPHVPIGERIEAEDLGHGFRRLVLHYGFRDEIDVPKSLANAKESELGFFYLPMSVSYFLSRETLIAAPSPEMNIFRKQLFLAMYRSSVSALEFFRLPTNRVVEMGSQVKI
jgi:KUP system potassium uptake protein